MSFDAERVAEALRPCLRQCCDHTNPAQCEAWVASALQEAFDAGSAARIGLCPKCGLVQFTTDPWCSSCRKYSLTDTGTRVRAVEPRTEAPCAHDGEILTSHPGICAKCRAKLLCAPGTCVFCDRRPRSTSGGER